MYPHLARAVFGQIFGIVSDLLIVKGMVSRLTSQKIGTALSFVVPAAGMVGISYLSKYGIVFLVGNLSSIWVHFTYIYTCEILCVHANETFLVPCSRGLSISVGYCRQRRRLLEPPSMRQLPPTRPSSLASCKLQITGKARSILFNVQGKLQVASCKLQVASCKASCS